MSKFKSCFISIVLFTGLLIFTTPIFAMLECCPHSSCYKVDKKNKRNIGRSPCLKACGPCLPYYCSADPDSARCKKFLKKGGNRGLKRAVKRKKK